MKGERVSVEDGRIIIRPTTSPAVDGMEMLREAPCGCAFLFEGDSIYPCGPHRRIAMIAVRDAIRPATT